MNEDRFPQLTPRERASELVQTAARLRQWSRELRRELLRLQPAPPRSGPPRPPPDRAPHGSEQTRNGARWRSFALALNWVALAILDVERHRMAGLLGWYQAQEERGVTPADVAFLTGRASVHADGARGRNRRKSR